MVQGVMPKKWCKNDLIFIYSFGGLDCGFNIKNYLNLTLESNWC